jgi:hypothetical protein
MTESEIQECPLCGREAGHHLGCAKILAPADTTALFAEPQLDELQESSFDTEQVACAADGCQDQPKPYGGRGPKPKYCAAHSAKKGV